MEKLLIKRKIYSIRGISLWSTSLLLVVCHGKHNVAVT